ncbi:histidine kinase, partial [Burkholderia thailandensis]|nr:histidine kinase [Burkholderia thailandensis]
MRRVRGLAGLVLFNCIVGLSSWASRRDDAVLPYLVLANGIGLSALLLSLCADKLTRGKLAVLPKVLIVAPVSVLAGFEIAASTIGHAPHLIARASVREWLGSGSSFVVTGIARAFVSLFLSPLPIS